MNTHLILKRAAPEIALTLVFPSVVLCGFGALRAVYTFFAQFYALGPGLPGGYLRSAFYKLTLRDASIDTAISMGTIFIHPESSIGPGVSTGSYCVIGRAKIGAETQIVSHVEIPSGRHQHGRGEAGKLRDSRSGQGVIGEYCWIGASAVILAAVGDHSTVGAGAVVVNDVPAASVAVGNPVRVIRKIS